MTATQTTMLNVKINKKLKKDIQKIGRNFGIPVSAMVTNALRNIVNTGRVEFTEDFTPNAKTANILDEALKDIKEGKNLSPEFSNMDEMNNYLDNL